MYHRVAGWEDFDASFISRQNPARAVACEEYTGKSFAGGWRGDEGDELAGDASLLRQYGLFDLIGLLDIERTRHNFDELEQQRGRTCRWGGF